MDNITNPYRRIFKSLKSIYDKKTKVYEDIRDLLAPGTGMFSQDYDMENQTINYTKQLDSEPSTYMDTTVAGLYGGLINPASRWFDLTLAKSNKYQNMDLTAIYQALELSKEFLYAVFTKSNFYSSMRSVLSEWLKYGIGVMLVEERDYDFIHFNPLTIGEFYLGINRDGKYTKLARTFQLTADQMIENFGYNNVPEVVRDAYKAGNYETKFKVYHLICENNNLDNLVSSRFKYVDLYWSDNIENSGKYLRVSGFVSNPIVVFSWERKNLRTIYPIGIGEKMLGDVKELQYTVKCININKSYLANPALALHTSLGKQPVLPGSRFYTDQDPTKLASEIFKVNPHIAELEDSRARLLDKIRKMSLADLLLIFAQQQKNNMTAREVAAIAQEQMTLLAPIYLQAKDGLQTLFDRVIDICIRRGAFPQVEGVDYKDIDIMFLSTIAKAQRIAEVGSIQDLIMYLTALAQIDQSALDFIDGDKIVIDVAERLGNVSKIRSPEEVAAIRQQRAEQQNALFEQQMRAEQMKVAKDASKAKIEPNNLLGQEVIQNGGTVPEDPKVTLEREKMQRGTI